MKKSTEQVVKALPVLEKFLINKENNDTISDEIVRLNTIEKTFLNLVNFYENPDKNGFQLQDLQENLSDDWLLLALDSMKTYFEKDTYLIKNTENHSLTSDEEEYLNQKNFVDFLNENGENYSEAKLSVYIQRELIPEPDLVISGRRHWFKSTCEKFLISLKKRDCIYEKGSLEVINKKLEQNPENILVLGAAGIGKTHFLKEKMNYGRHNRILIGQFEQYEEILNDGKHDITVINDFEQISEIDFGIIRFDLIFIDTERFNSKDNAQINEIVIEVILKLIENNFESSTARTVKPWEIIIDGFVDSHMLMHFLPEIKKFEIHIIQVAQSVKELAEGVAGNFDLIVAFRNRDKGTLDFLEEVEGTVFSKDQSKKVDKNESLLRNEIMNLEVGEFLIRKR